uniref:Uncharacterized protein n=1 Tax=Haptolina brevifila TaxID=156173 RepID=A0A7S2DT71_9EUKA|eukprot:CAMPEP_0174720932 /NCGR_PEP_ID=MMETSP1094-20130205/34935_1 /TAXON_ID=156173 /ORGANISM="Chrysochromulina brevifilum, Strain UTEX LB 985" /LENGTH=254 /DNA_ID=CAMNT_0015921517 /DNA_START=74 /DNA_END=838 /DNA_ORIENTATION=-
MAAADEATPLQTDTGNPPDQIDEKLKGILTQMVENVLAQTDANYELKTQVIAFVKTQVSKVEKLLASVQVLGTTVVLMLIFVLALFMAIPAIVTGSIYGAIGHTSCPGAPISLWLLVYACTSGGFVALGVLLLYCRLDSLCGRSCGNTATQIGGKLVAYLGALTGLFLFAWFIVGMLWLTSTASDEGMSGSPAANQADLASRCDAGLYGATRGFILFYALLPFCCFAGLCSGCCVLCAPSTASAEPGKKKELPA